MRKNKVEPDKPRMTIWRMRIACWIPKATDAHSEYVIRIASILQQWFTRTLRIVTSCVHSLSSIMFGVNRSRGVNDGVDAWTNEWVGRPPMCLYSAALVVHVFICSLCLER